MATNLKLLRVKHDLSQSDMADRCGVSRVAYGRIERGESKGSIRFWLNVKAQFPNETIEELAEAGK